MIMDEIQKKSDVAAREALAGGKPEQRLEVVVRVMGSTNSVRAEMEHSGLEIHSTTGPIATGVITAGRFAQLAALPFVRRVELSRALYPEE